MLNIWGRTNSINVQKAMWAVGELNLKHERFNAGGRFGMIETQAFRAMNPNGRVPVIEDNGTIIWESHTIIRYLAAQYGRGTLWPEDPAARSFADRWMDWTLADLQPAIMRIFWNLVRTPEKQRNITIIQQAMARSAKLLQVLDEHLTDKPFVTGDHFTMGDIPPATQLFRYFEMAIERPVMPHVEAWYERLKTRPAYREHVMISFEDLQGRAIY